MYAHNLHQLPFRYQVFCNNTACPYYLKIFDVGEEFKIPLIFTGRRAEPLDPLRTVNPDDIAGGVTFAGNAPAPPAGMTEGFVITRNG